MAQSEQIKEITDKLEKGLKALIQSDNYRDYLNTMSKFHNYSFNNSLLIAMQRPDATYVAGYQSWQKNFGRQVEKGEKAIKIIAPSPYKKIEETPILDKNGNQMLGLDGKPMTEKVEHIMPGFRVTSVFDVSQTSGAELPDICKQLDGSVIGYQDLQEALSRYSPAPINFDEISSGANGFYSSESKSITVKEGMSEAQTLKTSVHEVAHSILHDRDNGTILNADSRTKEVQAESVAYTVCQHYGLDTSDYSFGYVAGWSSDKDMKELKASMETIQSAARDMINGIDKHLADIRLEHIDEIAYKLSDGHLELHKTDSGYDFTIYDKEYHLVDGGQLDDTSLRIDVAAEESLKLVDCTSTILGETVLNQLQENVMAADSINQDLSFDNGISH